MVSRITRLDPRPRRDFQLGTVQARPPFIRDLAVSVLRGQSLPLSSETNHYVSGSNALGISGSGFGGKPGGRKYAREGWVGIATTTGIEDAVVKIGHGRLGVVGPAIGGREVEGVGVDGVAALVELTACQPYLNPSVSPNESVEMVCSGRCACTHL